MQLISRQVQIMAVLLLPILPWIEAAHGHDDKRERIAAVLQDTPAAYEPLNLELVGQIPLGLDL